MTNMNDLYKCSICGNVAEIVHPGAQNLVCCNKTMEKLDPKTEDIGKEKHVPIIEQSGPGILVKVGSIDHPMEEKHYIKFIEVLTKKQVLRAELVIGQRPVAEFLVKPEDILTVRSYCNLHDLWQNK
ncbi:MAG: desulfoferrodoxin [Desulfitobacteriaceae bacterium]|nr:desulfoferrodoxin [Desulfitobacteriaceae bacterium]MDD4346872.1 desulfoferrodoxin [Desulfitobacteriaceae bacterium]MDD4402127.1 desulfoferrodoxin [Desulfitobacteriaceae bacterium]